MLKWQLLTLMSCVHCNLKGSFNPATLKQINLQLVLFWGNVCNSSCVCVSCWQQYGDVQCILVQFIVFTAYSMINDVHYNKVSQCSLYQTQIWSSLYFLLFPPSATTNVQVIVVGIYMSCSCNPFGEILTFNFSPKCTHNFCAISQIYCLGIFIAI